MDPGFSILLAHLVGDYLLQEDWQATNKANPYPTGERPCTRVVEDEVRYTTPGTVADRDKWDAIWRDWMVGHLACTVHCLLYTLAFYLFCWQWVTVPGLLVCFATHWVIDRFRLARRWMRRAGQEKFATGGMAPWSIVIVDNTFHLLTAYGIYLATHSQG